MGFSDITVILAALNEEEGIGPTLAELREVFGDALFVVVDGNSTDRTVEIAKEFGAEVLVQRDVGKGNAISQALACMKCDPKYIVLTDADFTYPSKHALDMIRVLEDDPAVGMVMGNRFNSLLKAEKTRNPFYVGNRLLAIAQLVLNGIKLNDPLTGLRVVRWSILKGWRPRSAGFDIEAELNHRVERRGYRITELPIDYRTRLGEKKLKLRHGVSILKRILLESVQSEMHKVHSAR